MFGLHLRDLLECVFWAVWAITGGGEWTGLVAQGASFVVWTRPPRTPADLTLGTRPLLLYYGSRATSIISPWDFGAAGGLVLVVAVKSASLLHVAEF